jgi:hypothetical protein
LQGPVSDEIVPPISLPVLLKFGTSSQQKQNSLKVPLWVFGVFRTEMSSDRKNPGSITGEETYFLWFFSYISKAFVVH